MLTSVTVNRAPVLTLRAAIVAERLGFAWDLGRALAGLNAYKGMSLALFQPSPEVVRERRKKVHHGHRLQIDLLHRSPPERTVAGRPMSAATELEEAGVNETALFEESIDTNRGHCRVTIKVELGGDGEIRLEFQGRDAPTVSYEFRDPADALAIGKALVEAADVASAASGTEAG